MLLNDRRLRRRQPRAWCLLEEAQSPDPDEVDSGAQVEVETALTLMSKSKRHRLWSNLLSLSSLPLSRRSRRSQNKSSFRVSCRLPGLANSDTENIYEVAQNDEGNWVVLKRAKQEVKRVGQEASVRLGWLKQGVSMQM